MKTNENPACLLLTLASKVSGLVEDPGLLTWSRIHRSQKEVSDRFWRIGAWVFAAAGCKVNFK